MSQYSNFKKFLETANFFVACSEEEFYQTKKIVFDCSKGHRNILTNTSFVNKKSKLKNDASKLCDKCNHEGQDEQKLENIKSKVLEKTGHIIVEFVNLKTRAIKYQCGNCNNINKSFYSNLLHNNNGSCPNCQNQKFKNTIEEVKNRLNNIGYELMDYKNCHEVSFKCSKGHIRTMSLADLNRGRRCLECKPERTINTNLERFGVKNPFQSQEIKDKIKQTNLDKYGKTHHMKVPEIQQKTQNTMQEKYGIKFAFHSQECFDKIRQTCLERYGKKFPLQSDFIQAKVRQKFMESINAPYPMCNKDHWKNVILNKYGVDHYSKTDEFLPKYKNTCMGRYGVDFPAQNPKIFSKIINSRHSKKEFTFPNGRVVNVMGYEPICLRELLKTYNEDDIIVETVDIPVIEYKKLKKDKEGNFYEDKAVYYPDILLPDKLVEVKSLYTYEVDRDNNERKFRACVDKGYVLEVWVYLNENTLAYRITHSGNFIFTDYDYSI